MPRNRDAILRYPFTTDDIAMWTEWSDPDKIDAFFRSPKHAQFSGFAHDTLDRAFYRIIQYRDGEIKERRVPAEE